MKLQDLKCGQDLIQDSYISTQPPPHPARAHTHTHSLSTQFTFPGHSSGFWEWAGWGGAFITVDHSVTSSRILGVWVASSSSRDCFSETSLISNWRHLNKHLAKPPPRPQLLSFAEAWDPRRFPWVPEGTSHSVLTTVSLEKSRNSERCWVLWIICI